MDFEALNKKILPPDAQAEKAAWAHWDGIAKPLRGLGRLEEAVVRIAALTGSEEVERGKRAVLVLCADNTGEGEYYADLTTEDYGETRIIFTPNQAVLEAIQAALPRKLRRTQQ